MDEVRFRRSELALWASVEVTPTERRVPLARTGCTVRVQETGSGPALLFIHGAATGGASWAQLVAGLDGFRCLLLDRPGCALSDPLPAPLRRIEEIERYADGLVADVLDALDLERAHIVATSYGGHSRSAARRRTPTDSSGWSSWDGRSVRRCRRCRPFCGCWPCRASAGCPG